MTITQDPSAPLFVIVGSTGMQGRSVVKAIEESLNPYRVRAITRNASKSAARELEQIGCGVVKADVEDVESLKRAFDGATYAFLMTNTDYTDETPEFEHEFSQGKNQFDAAVAAGVKVIVWSGIPHMKELLGGKSKVDSFDIKARILAYGRALPSSVKIIDVQPGSFLTNFIIQSPPHATSEPNEFVSGLAMPGDASLPVIDIEEDYGKYVVGSLEYALGGDGEERWKEVETVHAAPGYITPDEMCWAFSQVSGKTVTYTQIPDAQLYATVESFAGQRAAGCVIEMYKAAREIGYFGGVDLAPSNAHLWRPARTFMQALEARPEVIKKIFDAEG